MTSRLPSMMPLPAPVLLAADAIPASGPSPAPRLHAVDALRGLALLGILLVNVHTMAFPQYAWALGLQPEGSATDRMAAWLVRSAVQGRFFPLFSLLFGLGAFLLQREALARGTTFAPLFARRMAALLGLGAAHALLLWNGDILFVYGAAGLLLPLVLTWRPSVLVASAVGLITFALVSVVGFAVALVVPTAAAVLQEDLASKWASIQATLDGAWRAYGRGSWSEAFAFRAQEWLHEMLPAAVSVLPVVLGMFLLGVALGKGGWVEAPAQHARALRRVATFGLLATLLLDGVEGLLLWKAGPMDVASPRLLVASAVELAAGPLQALGVTAGVLLLSLRSTWTRLLAPLAAAGRMSLTHYVSHSLLLTPLFCGWGLGLFGRLGSAALVGMALLLWSAQVAASPWWLRHFHLGPLEWLWRSLAGGRHVPFRRQAVARD